ncbi:MAG: FHA domain-containing protein [Planctomycetota bacterium]|nr:FHA domain-containing protein [Planctomycetota bacterium]
MAKLIVRDVEHTFLVDIQPDERLVVGRSHDCDVPVAALRASRRHVEVRGNGRGHEVVDLHSTNGTLLNGEALSSEAPLSSGDVIDVGGCTILYRA